jgi:hypothetical protein
MLSIILVNHNPITMGLLCNYICISRVYIALYTSVYIIKKNIFPQAYSFQWLGSSKENIFPTPHFWSPPMGAARLCLEEHLLSKGSSPTGFNMEGWELPEYSVMGGPMASCSSFMFNPISPPLACCGC